MLDGLSPQALILYLWMRLMLVNGFRVRGGYVRLDDVLTTIPTLGLDPPSLPALLRELSQAGLIMVERRVRYDLQSGKARFIPVKKRVSKLKNGKLEYWVLLDVPAAQGLFQRSTKPANHGAGGDDSVV